MRHVLLQGYLLSSKSKVNDLTEKILKAINEEKPKSVKQLVAMLKESLDLKEKVILESVLKLQTEGVIKLENQSLQSGTLISYMKTDKAVWYWLTIAAGAIAAALVFTVPESVYPWIYVRNFLGVIFVLFLPGFAFVKALFPISMPVKMPTESLESIERIALSLGMSLAIVAIVGLVLYYTPFGLSLPAIVASLLAFTLIFATTAIYRERLDYKKI
jgi:uncharacterized membrane protein